MDNIEKLIIYMKLFDLILVENYRKPSLIE